MKLTLLEADKVQKKWALVIEGSAPSIEQYKRNPGNYNTIEHGLYELEFELDPNAIWARDDGIRVRLAPGVVISILMNTRFTLVLIANGILRYNGSKFSITGRFDKQGSEINFRPCAE
ncbi:hypothetical protein pzkkv8_73 [Klebsiella phage pzk-kv8]|nr:hypothetical protein pzkkv8_73 [Klebsiella phage pzk-kv8]